MGELKLTYRIMRVRPGPVTDPVEVVDVEWSAEHESGEAAVLLNDQIRVPVGASDEDILAEIEYRGRTYVRPHLMPSQEAAPDARRGLLGKRRTFTGDKR